MRWGVEQSRNLMTVRAASQTGMPKVIDTADKLGVGKYPNYLVDRARRRRHHRARGWSTLMRSSPTRAAAVKPTLIDYVQDRNGKVIYRTDNRCAVMDDCNARRLGREGDAAAADPRPASCSSRWRRSRWSTSWKA